MELTVLYFAAARERAGTSREKLKLSDQPLTVASLLEEVASRHPSLRSLFAHLRVAVNQEFVASDALVPDGAEVALIPPVAGGSGLFKVVDHPLSLDEVIAAVGGTSQGGVVTFTGVVRSQSQGRRVLKLSYEAYPAMAEKKLQEIGAQAATLWPGVRVAIVHRIGELQPGEPAVVIAASAPHRKEAFLACEHTIDRLKQDVPIWKKEQFEDGEVWVGLGP